MPDSTTAPPERGPSRTQASPAATKSMQRGSTPPDSHVLDGSMPTLVMHNEQYAPTDPRFQAVELAVVTEKGGAMDLHAVMAELGRRQISEVHVEAGPSLCGSLFAAGLVDELLLYVAPVLLGDNAQPLMGLPSLTDMASRWKLRTIDRRVLGEDLRLLLRPEAELWLKLSS